MKTLAFLILAGVAFTVLPVGAAEEQWPKVSTGRYMGYAELYVVSEGNYIIEGDTNLGVECTLQVSQKGVDCDGTFFPWDHPGLQASRETKEGWERINFRGKVGNVVVADLTIEEPKGKVIRVMRMSVAQAPEESKTIGHETTATIATEVPRNFATGVTTSFLDLAGRSPCGCAYLPTSQH